MKPAVFLFLSTFLLIAARADRTFKIWYDAPEPSFDKYYRSWLNYHLEKYVKKGGIFFRTGQQLLPNSTTIDALNVNVTKNRGSLGFQLKNVTVDGFSNIFVDEFEARVYYGEDHNMEPFPIFELNVTIPTLKLHANHRLNGTWAGQNLDCTGYLDLIYTNISAGVHILIKPSEARSSRAAFEKVEIKYLTAQNERKIAVCNGPGVRCCGFSSKALVAAIRAPTKLSLVEKFQEKIRVGLERTFAWDSYYAVLFGKILH